MEAKLDAITGRERSGYIGRRLMETMSDSAIRVSLTARLDDDNTTVRLRAVEVTR